MTDDQSYDDYGIRGNSRLANGLVVVLGAGAIILAVQRIWNIQLFGEVLLNTSYLYLLLSVFLSLVFLIIPGRRSDFNRIPWFDWALFAVSLACTIYLAINAGKIALQGWEILAPVLPTTVGALLLVVALEAVRRAGGGVLFVICATFALLPLVADDLPGFLWGPSMTLAELVRAHSMGNESLIGLPMRVTGSLIIGFLIFGAALVVTGGGDFFMSFTSALAGRSRGGPAKVATLASGFFGSLSGSVIANIVTTGQVTIPTMKRAGYPANYAGAVEACASTGGVLMPPVMGAVAFLMAEFLDVSYATVMVAAVVPALLYYIALMFQTDLYAARNNLRGMEEADVPNIWREIWRGWPYLLALALLVYLLVAKRLESFAPYYATLFLIGARVLQDHRNFRFGLFVNVVKSATKSITQIVGVIAGVGMILGSLTYTGIGGAFSRELLLFAGDSTFLLLVLGALTSFLLGMGMTVSACYIFLAIVLAPALVEKGLDPVASHLFVLYWGMLSYVTPPVALAAITAASIAGGNAFMTGLISVRLSLIIFILPFLFVISPTLILQGAPIDIAHDILTAVIAVWAMSSAFEGWLYWYGRIEWERFPVFLAALVFLYPGLITDLVGAAILGMLYVLKWYRQNKPA